MQSNTGVTTSYYYFGAQRVAMRQGSTVYWLHGDHLGSASLTTDISGTTVSEMRYYPFGEVRWISGTMPTDRTFTGQRVDSYSNIIQMGARWYSPVSGRFLAPDSIVPRPGDPQALNRFSYAGNSPLNRLDPSGHFDISAFLAGFSDQFVDDLSLGIHSSMNVNVAERMHSDDSAEYNTGRVGGQLGALLFAGTEIGGGGTMAGGSIAAGGACAVLTIGACTPIGAAVAVGGATVGVGMVGHGLLIAGKVLSNGDPMTSLFADNESPRSEKPSVTNSAGDPYPQVSDPRTGKTISLPDGNLTRISPEHRTEWGLQQRGAFISEWNRRGFTEPPGGWDKYDIHHIKPREYGGTNDFWNLVPVERETHKLFSKFWERYP